VRHQIAHTDLTQAAPAASSPAESGPSFMAHRCRRGCSCLIHFFEAEREESAPRVCSASTICGRRFGRLRGGAADRWGVAVRSFGGARVPVRLGGLMWREGCGCGAVVLPVGGCLPASLAGWSASYGSQVLAGLSVGLTSWLYVSMGLAGDRCRRLLVDGSSGGAPAPRSKFSGP
jgi:hypothetical protein